MAATVALTGPMTRWASGSFADKLEVLERLFALLLW